MVRFRAGFTVTLTAESTEPVTVSYATSNSSATAGSDYLVDPVVDQARRHAELIGQIADRLLAGQMPADDLGLLLGRKLLALRGYGNLRSG